MRMSPAAFCTPLAPAGVGGWERRGAVCRRRPRACAEAPGRADAVEVSGGAAGGDGGGGASYLGVPGKIVLSEAELAAQRARLDRLTEQFKQERLVREYEESRKFGFVEFAETVNGRSAAFFFVVGLLTEYWTGYTIPQQIELMANTLGIF